MTKITKVSRGGGGSFLLAATIALCAAQTVRADKYWVGGANGLWSGNNWASSAGGEGGSWSNGTVGWFTTSPSTIDFNGTSQSVSRFKISGFSSGRCIINITNSSATASTLTYKGFNRGNNDDLNNADLTVSNVALVDGSSWGVEIFNGSSLKIGEGASYTRSAANSDANVYIGNFLAKSNTIEVASGGTFTALKNMYIGCPGSSYVANALTGVFLVNGGTASVLGSDCAIYMGRCKDNETTGVKSTSILEVRGGTLNANEIFSGTTWAANQSYSQKSEIRVNSGGTLNLSGRLYAREYGANTITIDGGTLSTEGIEPQNTSDGCYRAKNYSVTVKNNGVLAVRGIYFNTLDSYVERINFDNGTFKALASFTTHNYTSYESKKASCTEFTIGAGGMKIDTQGYTLTWNTRIASGSGKITKEGSGTLAFGWTCYATGGIDVKTGTLSVTGSNTYFSGPVTVKNGATVKNAVSNVPAALGTSVTFEDGAKLAVPAADGVLSVIKAPAISIEGTTTVSFPNGFPGGRQTILTMTGSGSFTAEDAAKLTVPASAAGYAFYVSSNGKSIQIGPAAGRWTGAAGNLLIDDTGNWSDNVVPDGTPAFIAVDAATTLQCNGTFRPKSITFAADSKAITFNGEGCVTGIEAITNLNASSTQTNHRFNIPVSGDTVDLNNRGVSCCLFWGGFTVANPVLSNSADIDNAHSLAGRWTITGASWSPSAHDTVSGSASITFEHELKNPGNFNIASGAVVTAATMKVTSSTYPAYSNSGRVVVNGICDVSNTSADFSLAREDSQNATVILGGLVFNTSRWAWLNAKTIVIGSEGIKFNANNNLRFAGTPTLYAKDEALTLHAGKNANRVFNIVDGTTLTICTTQFESAPASPATVNIDGVISNAFNSTVYGGGMAVTGIGKVVFNSASTFTGGLTIGDTATVAINPGKQAGTGAITVNSGATLEVPESGTVTLAGNLTLQDGAKLKFGINGDNETILVLASGKTLPASGTVAIEFAEGSIFVPGRTYTLLSGGNLQSSDKDKFSLPQDDKGELDVDASNNLVYTAPEYFYIRVADNGRFSLKDESDNVINVDIPVSWIYAKTGESDSSSPSAIATALADDGANGIPVWQSYCLGLEPANSQSVVLCEAAADQSDTGRVAIKAGNINIPEGLEGVVVSATLERKIPGGEFTAVTNATFASGAVAFTTPEIGDGISFFV